MAYSDFTMSELTAKFGIKEQPLESLFDKKKLTVVTPSTLLLQELEDGKYLPFFSEKAKSENFITPILREVWRIQKKQFQLFSGYTFNVSEADKLTGVCDYLFSTEITVTEIKSVVFCVIEAKNRGVIEGVAQAFAEMYAAQLFNAEFYTITPVIYGCVTNATEWLFLKLENKKAFINIDKYAIDEANLPTLLSVLKFVTDYYLTVPNV